MSSSSSSSWYVGAIDQGTTSTRFILFDKTGKQVASSQVKFNTVTFPDKDKSGWSEQDPELIYSTVCECINNVLSSLHSASSSSSYSIRAIGITNQRETSIIWDRITSRPLHAALVWHDTRTKSYVQQLNSQLTDSTKIEMKRRSGLPISTYFSALKIRWLIDHVPAVQRAIQAGTAMFGTIDTWLLWKLSGGTVHATDVSNASRTSLMSLSSCQWDPFLFDAFKIPFRSGLQFPDIRSNCEIYANVKEGALRGVPIAGLIGDQQAALLGQCCTATGSVKNTYGTGCFMLMNTGTQIVHSQHGLLSTVAFQLGNHSPCMYALEGAIGTCGSAVEWLKNVGLVSDFKKMDDMLETIPDSGGIVFVPAFSGLLSPYFRDDARGLIIGVTHSTTSSHIIRSVIDAIAWQTKEVLDVMKLDLAAQQQQQPAQNTSSSSSSSSVVSSLKVDGGLSRSPVLLRVQSAVTQLPIIRAANIESTALGAAIAAGLGVGAWSSVEEVERQLGQNALVVQPQPFPQLEQAFDDWKRAVQRSLGWLKPTPPVASKL